MSENPLRLQVVEQIESRDGTMAFDSKVVNGIIENGQISKRAIKRSGLAVAFSGTNGIGQGIVDYLNVLYSISGDTLNQFESISQLPALVTPSAGFSPRSGAAEIGFLGKLWVIGGSNATTFANDTWTSVDGLHWGLAGGNPPSTRNLAKAIVLNNVLYVMGGQNAAGAFLRDVWKTSDGVVWTQVTAAAPWGGRGDFELLLFNNTIMLAGGAGVASPNGVPDPGLYHDVWSTPDGIAWTQQVQAAPWIGRRRFGFYSVGSTLYVLGGLVSSGTNVNYQNAVTDLWSSVDNGVTWTRVNSNAFGVAGCPMLPLTIITSPGEGAPYATAVTVTNGIGGTGAAARCFVVGDDDVYEDEWADYYDIDTVTFTTVGSGYTSACTFAVQTQGIGIPAIGYGFLDGTAVLGGRGGEVVKANNTYYYFTTFINGAQANEIWSSPDGVNWTLITNSPGYATRSMQVFVFGNIWIIGGNTGGVTYFNDVWEMSAGSTVFPLTPTVAGEFYDFNQTATSLATPLLVFKSAHQGYYFNASLGTLNRITDPDYPAVLVHGLVYLDTTFYVMDPQGRIWGSNQNDPSNWTALNEIAIQNEPNGGVGIAKVGTYLVGFGQWSCEFFYDNANAFPGSPLSANSTLAYQVGCAAGQSIVEMEGSVIWVGQTSTEGAKVYTMQGYTPVVTSTPFIDRILQTDPLTHINAFATTHFGHVLYVLNLLTIGVTLAYDFTMQTWYTWNSSLVGTPIALTSLSVNPLNTPTYALATASTAPVQHGLQDGDPIIISAVAQNQYNGSYSATVLDNFTFQYIINAPGTPQSGGFVTQWNHTTYQAVAAAQLNDIDYVQDPANGVVYSVAPALGNDYGNPIDFNVVTPRWDGGTMHEKFVMRASIIGDKTPSNVLVRHSEDDYQTWSLYRAVHMSARWPNISALGMIYRTAFQLRHTDPSPQRLEGIEIEVEVGV